MGDIHLAIATVPKQTWGELYVEAEALRKGTIFKDLDLPFFAAVDDVRETKTDVMPKSQEQQEREQMMRRIAEVSFLLDDLTLYLDTHEQDANALSLYHKKSVERWQLKQDFAKKFYPLMREYIAVCEETSCFAWQEGPMPWEGGCI